MSLVALLSVLTGLFIASAGVSVAHADMHEEAPFSISSAWPRGVQAFLRVETSPPVFNVLYHYGRTTAGVDGGYGPNAEASRSSWAIELQRYGDTDVIAGVLHRDTSLIDAGLRMFHFGLAREASNGAFPGSLGPFHGTAMFLAQAAPALLVLEYSPLAARYATELKWEIARMRLAVYHMVAVVGGPGRMDDGSKNHRFYEAAMAVGAVGVLAGDARLQRWSSLYAWAGIRMERRDGVMPEDGGHDVSYQGLGLTHATRYLELLATGPLYRALYQALARAETWERSRVSPDGVVDTSGDTRTIGCREQSDLGGCKTSFSAAVFSALARWAAISGNSRYARAAYMVWLQNWIHQPGDVLPKAGLWANPSVARRGDWLTVWGTRFQPLEVVRVYFDHTLEQTIPCDQVGSFGGHSPEPNAHFALPTVTPGTYTVTAVGSFGTVRRTRVRVLSSGF